jgi:hypothetical protein
LAGNVAKQTTGDTPFSVKEAAKETAIGAAAGGLIGGALHGLSEAGKDIASGISKFLGGPPPAATTVSGGAVATAVSGAGATATTLTGASAGSAGATLGSAAPTAFSKGSGGNEMSQSAKRSLAKEQGGVPRSAQPTKQGTHVDRATGAKTSWWEYTDSNGDTKIVVEHPDSSVHVGTPKPQSTHQEGGPPKYYQEPGTGHVGEDK